MSDNVISSEPPARSFGRRLLFRSVAATTVVEVADQVLGGAQLFGLNTNAVPSTKKVEAEITKYCDTQPGRCEATSDTIKKATDLWLTIMEDWGRSVPYYINADYTIGCAVLESTLNPKAHRANSKFANLYQFAQSSQGTSFYDNPGDLIKYLNCDDVRKVVPSLKIKPRPPQKRVIPRDQKAREDLMKKWLQEDKEQLTEYTQNHETNSNIYVQVAALLFNTLAHCEHCNDNENFNQLSPDYKRAYLYLASHNLPTLGKTVLDNINSDETIGVLRPELSKAFTANSGMYSDGNVTPRELLHRIYKFTSLQADRFNPDGAPHTAAELPPPRQNERAFPQYGYQAAKRETVRVWWDIKRAYNDTVKAVNHTLGL